MWKFRKFQEINFGNFRNFQMSKPFIWEISDFQPNLEIFDGITLFLMEISISQFLSWKFRKFRKFYSTFY